MRSTRLLGGLALCGALLLAGCGGGGVSDEEIIEAAQGDSEGELPEEASDCLVEGARDEFSDDELEGFVEDPETSEITGDLQTLLGSCVLGSGSEEVQDFLIEQFTASGLLSEEEAKCFVDALQDEDLDLNALVGGSADGEQDPEEQQKLFEALTKCAPQLGAGALPTEDLPPVEGAPEDSP